MSGVKSSLRAVWSSHPTTLVAMSRLAISYGVLTLRAADVVPMSGVWRAVMIPGYLTFLGGAVLSNFLVPSIFIPVPARLLLTPCAAMHALRRRLSKAPPAI